METTSGTLGTRGRVQGSHPAWRRGRGRRLRHRREPRPDQEAARGIRLPGTGAGNDSIKIAAEDPPAIFRLGSDAGTPLAIADTASVKVRFTIFPVDMEPLDIASLVGTGLAGFAAAVATIVEDQNARRVEEVAEAQSRRIALRPVPCRFSDPEDTGQFRVAGTPDMALILAPLEHMLNDTITRSVYPLENRIRREFEADDRRGCDRRINERTRKDHP